MAWQADIPKELLALDDFECANRLAALRWGANGEGLRCAKCGGSRHHHLRCRPREWACAKCRHRVSVTAGTLFHGTSVPLRVWLIAAHLMTSPSGTSAAAFQRRVGLKRYDTAWRVLQRMRAAMALFGTFVTMASAASVGTVGLRGEVIRRPFGDRRLLTEVGGARELAEPHRVVIDLPHRGDLLRAIAGCPLHGPEAPRVRDLDWFLANVHHRVSRTWLRRYLAEAAVRLGPTSPNVVLERMLADVRSTWARLRPPADAALLHVPPVPWPARHYPRGSFWP